MGCIVKNVILENGQESALYNDLLETMSDGLALETYLEMMSNETAYKEIFGVNEQGQVNGKNYVTTPKFKLANFETYQQQLDVMDYLTEEVLNELQAKSKTHSKTTLSGINLDGLTSDPLVIPAIIKSVKKNIKRKLTENNFPEAQAKLFNDALENLDSYIGLRGELGPLGVKLADYGVNIKIQERANSLDALESIQENEGDIDIEKATTDYGKIYDMSILESSPSNSISAEIKIYLRGVKRVNPRYKVNPKKIAVPTYVQSELGVDRPGRYELITAKLFGILKGVQSISEMKAKIKNSLKASPELTPVYLDLINEVPKNINKIGDYNALSTALFSLAKQNYNMFSFVELANGDVTIMNANSSSVQSKLKDRWALAIGDVQKKYKKDDVDKPLKSRQAKLKSIKEFLAQRVIKNNKSVPNPIRKNLNAPGGPNGVTLSQVANHFVSAGFERVTKVDLENLINTVTTNPQRMGMDNATPYGIIKGLMEALPVAVLEGKDIFTSSKDSFGERRSLNLLSDVMADRMDDIHVGAYLSPRGTIIQPTNVGSESQDIFSRLQSDADVMAAFADDPMYADTLILNLLGDPAKNNTFKLSTMDTLTDNRIPNSGRTYGQLSTFDATISRMNAFFDQVGGAKNFQAFSPTQADRGNLLTLTVPKLNLDNKDASQIVYDNGTIKSEEVGIWVANQLKAELTRIARSKDINGYVNYSDGNAGKFNLFTNLNEDQSANLANLSDDAKSINQHVIALYPLAEKEFIKTMERDKAYLVRKGVLQKEGDVYSTTKESSPLFNKAVGTKKGRGKKSSYTMSKADLETFLANNFVYTYEQTLFFIGDPAFYKAGTDSAQKINMNKRFGLPFTPGVKLATEENTGMPKNANIKILKEGKVDSEYSAVYKELTGHDYKGIELADGGGWVSLDRYKRLMLSRGLHTDDMLTLIDDLNNWEQGKKVPISDSSSLSALKSFYFKLQQTKEGIIAPFNLKYSIFPAIPTLFEQKNADGTPKFPAMDKISRELRSTDPTSADEVVMPTAVKSGQHNIATLDNLGETEAIIIDNNAVRFPQVTPVDFKTEDRLGSQMRKLVIGNYIEEGMLHMGEDLDGNVLELDAKDAKDKYNDALSKLAEDGGESVYNDFIHEDGTADEQTLVKKLLKDLATNPQHNAEFFQEALVVADGETSMLPLNYPSIKYRLDNLINASFRTKVNKLKLPGHSAVQISSYGMSADKGKGLSIGSDLKFMRFARNGVEVGKAEALRIAKEVKKGIMPEGVTMTPAEIRVTPKYFINTLRNIARKKAQSNLPKSIEYVNSQMGKFGKISLAESASIRRLLLQASMKTDEKAIYNKMIGTISNADGSLNLDLIRKAGLDEVVGYRIPTGGKNLMFPGIIKEFLPPESGGTIQVPAEIVEQAGSDFDIDKVSLEMSPFEYRNGKFQKISWITEDAVDIRTKAQAQAYIIDFHRAVLKSPRYALEMLLPNGTPTLTKVVDNILGKEESLASFGSLELQEDFRNNNKSGKDLISISSVASVMHSVAQQVGAKFIAKHTINGKPLVLGMRDNLAGDNLISNEIAEIQNAALDNANDPLLGRLNIDEFTASAALLLVSSGHGLSFASTMLNAPIVLDLAGVYPRFARKQSPKQALKSSIAFVEAKYDLKRNQGKRAFKLRDYSLEEAVALRNPKNKEDHAKALQAFLKVRELGSTLADFQRAMNIDSKGVPASVMSLFDKYYAMSNIIGTEAYFLERTDPIMERKGDTPKPLMSVDREKYSQSHLSTMELYSLRKPLEVNRVISPNASDQMQGIITEMGGIMRLTEKQQIQMLADYDMYLATNSRAHTELTSGLSEFVNSNAFTNLTKESRSDATGNILTEYRKYVRKYGLTENAFTENLTIKKEDGRIFVTFNNTVARAMSGEAKKEMMFFYEDLMDGNPLERKLAESLANYGVSHYGFSTSINSFVAFLSPRAHTNFMGKKKGTALPEYFRGLKEKFNDADKFRTPYEFIDMYVANNAHRLSIHTESTQNEDWASQLLDNPDPEYKAPAYVKIHVRGGKINLYKNIGFGYAPMQIRGIPNLVSEYHMGDSKFNEDMSVVNQSPEVAKENASEENQVVIKNIEKATDYTSFSEVLNTELDFAEVGSLDTMGEIQAYATKVEKRLLQDLTAKETESVVGLIQGVINGLGSQIKRVKRKGKSTEGVIRDRFKDRVELAIREVADGIYAENSNKFIIEKIKKC